MGALFKDYEGDQRPTREQIAALPPSLTGLGLDQPRSTVESAAATMDRDAFEAMSERFCSGSPDSDEHACSCTALDSLTIEGEEDWRVFEAHVDAEQLAWHRFVAVWYTVHEPATPVWFGDVPASTLLAEITDYEPEQSGSQSGPTPGEL